MAKKDIQVVPHKKQWATRWEGAQRVSHTFDTQGEAHKGVRNAAGRELIEVVTHRRDGTIRDRESFGHAPLPPRDKNH